MDAQALAKWVYDKRMAKKWGRSELAAQAGVTIEYIKKLEDGKSKQPQIQTLENVVKALGESIDEFKKLMQIPPKKATYPHRDHPLVIRLRECRKRRGETQEQVALGAGITRESLRNYEIGSRLPALDILLLLVDYYQCSLDWLTGRETVSRIFVDDQEVSPEEVEDAIGYLKQRRWKQAS